MEPTTAHDDETRPGTSKGGRLLAIVGAGLLAGLMAMGATTLASAQPDQSVADPVARVASQSIDEAASDTEVLDEHDDHDYDDDMRGMIELAPADEAVLNRFESCVDDAFGASGLDLEALEQADDDDTLTDAEEDELDAVFDEAIDSCDPILADLSIEAQDLLDDWEDEEDCDDDDDDDDMHDSHDEDDDESGEDGTDASSDAGA